MRFTVTFDCGNDALQADDHVHGAHMEIDRILRDLADKVRRGSNRGRIIDANGNNVGEFRLSEHTTLIGE